MTRSLGVAAVLTAGIAVAVGVTVLLRPETEGTRSGRILVPGADFPVALTPLPDGDLLYAERLTGRVRRVASSGALDPRPVAQVEVATKGQRGLVGLAAVGREIFAAWTRPLGDLVVGRVAPGPVRIVWRGPRSAELANGGHLAGTPDGSLLVGIGDLQQPERVDDPRAPNGKILRLDPAGGQNQQPEVVSGGWNNPFAFDVTLEGELWVADNDPGDVPERLVRVGPDGAMAFETELPADTAPSGLAVTPDGLVVCGFRSKALLPYRVVDGRAEPAGPPLAEDCETGVALLADDHLVYARRDAILVADG
ncbi:MAG: PQQ-dependent sugar dehydrogenase [Actinomycetota bacterium]